MMETEQSTSLAPIKQKPRDTACRNRKKTFCQDRQDRLKPIGSMGPNGVPYWKYLLTAAQVHTTTHSREQHWDPHLLRPALTI